VYAAAVSRILYIDGRIAVINKPPGISLATPRSDPTAAVARLLSLLSAEERAAYGLDPAVVLLVHRLDVGTSGLVLAARDSDAHRELAQALSGGRIERTYLALVWGHPRPAEGRYEVSLGPDRCDRRRMKPDPGGRAARTAYRTLARLKHVSLVELRPETGRTHQIRVHLAQAGHWIVGDDLYAGQRQRALRDETLRHVLTPGHTLLHAWRLALPENRLTPVRFFEAPLPEDFAAALGALGALNFSGPKSV
jgi:RluA family pseudouridine synthase